MIPAGRGMWTGKNIRRLPNIRHLPNIGFAQCGSIVFCTSTRDKR